MPNYASNPDSSFSLDRFKEFSDNDPVSFRELIDLYLHQTHEQLAKLESALEKGDAQEVARVAHSCAGSSATCGIEKIVTPFRELEKLGYTGDLLHAKPHYEAAVLAVGQFNQYVRTYFGDAASPGLTQ